MNTPRTLAAALVIAAFAGSAFAQEATPDHWLEAGSTADRAAVHAAAVAAQRAGQIGFGEATQFVVLAESVRSRAQVQAEAVEALRLGLLDRGEANAPAATPAQAEQVRQAGLRAAGVPMAQIGR
jgi:hypothetical protein